MPLSLTLYRGLTRLVPLAAPWVLRRRLARGKEDPDRWSERLGRPGMARPDSPLVWLNAVGLGEVLALRALIPPLAEALPDAHFLVTSTARSSARAFAGQMPARTIHQFLPLDAPQYLTQFYDHWRPGLVIWTDQDLWPGAISMGEARHIPQAWVNGRMNAASRARWRRAPGLLAALLKPMAIVAVQTVALSVALRAIGVRQAQVLPSLKPAAPPLDCDLAALARLRGIIGDRPVWVVAPSHAADEAAALAAHATLRQGRAGALLILCPRDPARGAAVADAARAAGYGVARRSSGEEPSGADVYVADTIGEMGLWYRLGRVAFIGGTLDETQGHSPWEALALGVAVLHGPQVANFADDYARLDSEGIALEIGPEGLAAAVMADAGDRGARGRALCEAARKDLVPLAHDLAMLVRR